MKKKIIISILTLFLIPGFSFAQKGEDKGFVSKVIGTWKLVSIEATRPNGEIIRDWGQNPTGLIIYDSNGNMAVQFMRDPRPVSVSSILTANEMKAAFQGYIAYFGTYEFDEKLGTVTHHIKSSMRPNEVGTDYIRNYKLLVNKLTLTTPPMQSVTVNKEGELRVYSLTWERMK